MIEELGKIERRDGINHLIINSLPQNLWFEFDIYRDDKRNIVVVGTDYLRRVWQQITYTPNYIGFPKLNQAIERCGI